MQSKTLWARTWKPFYASEAEIQNNPELQMWAKQCSKLQSVRGFPEKFASYADLRSILSNLVFQSTARHRMMHGSMTWYGIAAPYMTPALWSKPLPTAKDTRVDPLDYAMPPELLPELSYFAASAARPVPPHFLMLHAYSVEPFANETKLGAPIARFQEVM